MHLFGVFWILPFVAWTSLPVALRAGLTATPLFVLIVFALGALYEPRQLMPLFPILVPSSLFALFGDGHPPQSTGMVGENPPIP